MLNTYEDFKKHLQNVGFMPLSNNKIGFPSLVSLTIEEAWHTGEVNDPWIWRRLVAEERLAAYGKFFDKKPSFITMEWFPYFLSTRKGLTSVEELYAKGKLSHAAKCLYELFKGPKEIPAHDVRPLLGRNMGKTEVDNALTELQMGMFLTMSGVAQKTNAQGAPYGWPSVCLMKVEDWVDETVMDKAAGLDLFLARNKIMAKARDLCPDVTEKQLAKFLAV
ncbi:MAG: hypothetical protein DDT35_01422 [Firmicutes bacterium]|nr:hypothetical protein [Bacillota bacterium]